MKKVKYNGTMNALLPTLDLEVKPGDEIDVPDDFANALFSEVFATVAPAADKPSDTKPNDTKEAKQ